MSLQNEFLAGGVVRASVNDTISLHWNNARGPAPVLNLVVHTFWVASKRAFSISSTRTGEAARPANAHLALKNSSGTPLESGELAAGCRAPNSPCWMDNNAAPSLDLAGRSRGLSSIRQPHGNPYPSFMSGSTESRRARTRRDGTGRVNPAQGFLVREQRQAKARHSGCTDSSRRSARPAHTFKGSTLLTKAPGPSRKSRRGGHIFTGSRRMHHVGGRPSCTAGALKAGLVALSYKTRMKTAAQMHGSAHPGARRSEVVSVRPGTNVVGDPPELGRRAPGVV